MTDPTPTTPATGQAEVSDVPPTGSGPGQAEVGDSPPASYAAAEAELEQILAALEDEGVDVDQLSGHVQRAKALITWCRARVASAEVTITELLADGEPPRPGAAGD